MSDLSKGGRPSGEKTRCSGQWTGGIDLKEHFPDVGAPYFDPEYGYIMANIKGFPRRVHRLVWEAIYGEIPQGLQIDHKDGDRTNNRVSNLRLATNQQNSSNRKVEEMTNIDVRCGNYRVKICHFGETKYFGTYDDLELAQLVRDEARIMLNGEFNGR